MPRQVPMPDLAALVTTQALNTAVQSLPQYVNNGQWITRADLKANFPAGPDVLGKLAKVLDVWNTVKTSMICEQDTFGSGAYYWRPQRVDYSIPVTQTSGTFNLIPLVTPPSLVFKIQLVGGMNIVPTTNVDVWPGCFFDIQAPSLGLFSLNLTGLVGGVVQNILGGNRKRVIYTRDGWEAS